MGFGARFFFQTPPYFGISGLFHLGIPFRLFRSFVPRHPIVLEKSTPPWFRTSFHENAWNMANRSIFVKIVIFVSFFETYYFLGAPSTNGQKNRTQLERNFAQVERNLKKYYTLQKYTSKIVYFFGRRPLFCEMSSKLLKRQLFN